MRSALLLCVALYVAGCSTIMFEGVVNRQPDQEPKTTNRYRIAELVVIPSERGKTDPVAVSLVRIVGAIPETVVNAVAAREFPAVFSLDKDAVPIRVAIHGGVDDTSGTAGPLLSGFTFGIFPAVQSTWSDCEIKVSAFGIQEERPFKVYTGRRMSLLGPLGFIALSPQDENDPIYMSRGLLSFPVEEYDGAVDVLTRTIVPVIVSILKKQESCGAYFTARNGLKPDYAKAAEYDLILESGLITRGEYESAIIRYAEQRDPSRVAVDFAKLRDQGVISSEDYRNEVLKVFHVKPQDTDKGSGR